MVTPDDQVEEGEDEPDEGNVSGCVRDKLKFYENKVLQAESERIEKEKENLELKETVMRLQSQLRAREQQTIGDGTRFEGAAEVLAMLLFVEDGHVRTLCPRRGWLSAAVTIPMTLYT